MTEIGNDTLNRLWVKFAAKYLEPTELMYLCKFDNASRRSPMVRRFEDWLFSHGAIIQQRNKKRYFIFLNDEYASFFLLQHL